MHDSTSNVVVLLLAKSDVQASYSYGVQISPDDSARDKSTCCDADIPDWCCHNSLDNILSLS